VRYSSSPLSKKCHFGHVGGADRNLTFALQKTAPVTTGKSKERKERISKASMLTLQEIISDGLFESDSHTLLRKPAFFFGDSIEEDETALYDRNYKWLRQIGDRKFFLPNMERTYPLAYLQHVPVRRIMGWDLVKSYSRVPLGKIGAHEAYTVGHGLGLHPGLIRSEYPKGETPRLGATFLQQFLEVGVTSPLNIVRSVGFILLTSIGGIEW